MNRFLFDENVPTPPRLQSTLPMIHATALGMRVSDSDLWHYAEQKRLVIVSKDADFSNRVLQASPPPWVVHLKFGNLRRAAFENVLAKAWPQVESLLPTHKLIRVFADRIESVRD